MALIVQKMPAQRVVVLRSRRERPRLRLTEDLGSPTPNMAATVRAEDKDLRLIVELNTPTTRECGPRKLSLGSKSVTQKSDAASRRIGTGVGIYERSHRTQKGSGPAIYPGRRLPTQLGAIDVLSR